MAAGRSRPSFPLCRLSFFFLLVSSWILRCQTEVAPVILSFVGDEDGIALESADKKFLTIMNTYDNKAKLGFTRRLKNENTKFKIDWANPNQTRTQRDAITLNGWKLEGVQDRISGSKSNAPTKLSVVGVGGANATQVALRHLEGKCFLKQDGEKLICVNEEISAAATFKVESGALVPPNFEFVDVKFDTSGLDKVNLQPTMMNSEVIRNPTAATVESTITLRHDQQRTETTTWQHQFGVGFTASFEAKTNFLVAEGKFSTSLKVNYDYTTGGSATSVKTQEISKTLTLTVPPYASIKSKLMVRMAQDAEVPFEATIRKTRNGKTTTLTEKGVWKGVVMSESYVENADVLGPSSRSEAAKMRWSMERLCWLSGFGMVLTLVVSW